MQRPRVFRSRIEQGQSSITSLGVQSRPALNILAVWPCAFSQLRDRSAGTDATRRTPYAWGHVGNNIAASLGLKDAVHLPNEVAAECQRARFPGRPEAPSFQAIGNFERDQSVLNEPLRCPKMPYKQVLFRSAAREKIARSKSRPATMIANGCSND
jgi:hypothetical protein